MTDDRVVELKSYRGYIAVEQCDLDFEEAIREAYAVNGPVVSLIAEFRERFQRVDPSIESLQAEVEDLKHDLDRYMKIANIECNEAEDLRHILRAARPYISDRAGIGIIGAIDQALAAKEQTRDR